MTSFAIKNVAIAEIDSEFLYAFMDHGRPAIAKIGTEASAYSKIYSNYNIFYDAAVAYSSDKQIQNSVFLLRKEERGRLINIARVVIRDPALVWAMGNDISIKYEENRILYESTISAIVKKADLVLLEESYAKEKGLSIGENIILHSDPVAKDVDAETIIKALKSITRPIDQ